MCFYMMYIHEHFGYMFIQVYHKNMTRFTRLGDPKTLRKAIDKKSR